MVPPYITTRDCIQTVYLYTEVAASSHSRAISLLLGLVKHTIHTRTIVKHAEAGEVLFIIYEMFTIKSV